jgi:hypothetical protein
MSRMFSSQPSVPSTTGSYHRIDASHHLYDVELEAFEDDLTALSLGAAPALAPPVSTNPRVRAAEPQVRASRRHAAASSGGWLNEASSEVDLGVRTWDELERDAAAYTLLTNQPVPSTSLPPPPVAHPAPPPWESNPFRRRGGGADMLNTVGSAEEAFWARATGRATTSTSTSSHHPAHPRSQVQTLSCRMRSPTTAHTQRTPPHTRMSMRTNHMVHRPCYVPTPRRT